MNTAQATLANTLRIPPHLCICLLVFVDTDVANLWHEDDELKPEQADKADAWPCHIRPQLEKLLAQVKKSFY